MSQITRRHFIQKSVSGAVVAGALLLKPRHPLFATEEKSGLVELGKTGIKVSRLAMGSGSKGGRHHSNQTKLGMKGFVELTHHALDLGINFFDTADMYGSHVYFREALKNIPRDKYVILSKMWTQPNNWLKIQTADQYLELFLKELGVDYIDIILLHCMVKPNWLEEMAEYCVALEKAREKGLIRAHGVSCHTLSALQAAVKSDWVQVLMARINPTGVLMDDKPEAVMPLLKETKDRGAGVIGMKIYGEGRYKTEAERQQSLEYVWRSGNVHAMTIGFEKIDHIDDTLKRTNQILNG